MSPRRLSAAAFTQEKLFEKNIDSPAVRTVASPLPSERFLCPPRRAHVRAAPACRAHRAGHKWMQRRCPLRATYLRTPGLQAQGLTRLVRAATAQPRWHVFPACVCGALARRGGPRALTLPRSRSSASSPCPRAVSQPPWLLRRLLRLSCSALQQGCVRPLAPLAVVRRLRLIFFFLVRTNTLFRRPAAGSASRSDCWQSLTLAFSTRHTRSPVHTVPHHGAACRHRDGAAAVLVSRGSISRLLR